MVMQGFCKSYFGQILATFYWITILAEWGSETELWNEQSMQAPYNLWFITIVVNLDEPRAQELHFGNKLCIVKIILFVSIGQDERRSGLMVSVLDSRTSFPGYCAVFLGKTLHSHGASLHLGV